MYDELTFSTNTPVVKIIEKSKKGKSITILYIYHDVKKKQYNLIGKKCQCHFKYNFKTQKTLRKFVELVLDDDYNSSITLHNYMTFKDFKDLSFDFLEKYNETNELAGYDNAEKKLFEKEKYFKNFIKLAKDIAKSTRI